MSEILPASQQLPARSYALLAFKTQFFPDSIFSIWTRDTLPGILHSATVYNSKEFHLVHLHASTKRFAKRFPSFLYCTNTYTCDDLHHTSSAPTRYTPLKKERRSWTSIQAVGPVLNLFSHLRSLLRATRIHCTTYPAQITGRVSRGDICDLPG